VTEPLGYMERLCVLARFLPIEFVQLRSAGDVINIKWPDTKLRVCDDSAAWPDYRKPR
jgi:hypothetical protein